MKNQKQMETVVRSIYVVPLIEVYDAEPSQFMELSGQHKIGGDDGEENGAKGINLNISFTDPWEGWEDQD